MRKFYTLLLGAILTSTAVSAQDECTTASNATVTSSCTPVTFNLPGTLTQSANLPTGCNVGNMRDDAWLVFTAVSGSTTISYTNTSRDAAIWLYSGTCGSLTQLACSDGVAGQGTETIVFGTTAGTTYYVRIGRMSGNNTANMAGSYCIYSDNNECSGAFNLTVGTGCAYISGNINTATVSTPAFTCATPNFADVWYRFTATATSHTVSVQGSVSFNPAFEVYTGACGAQTPVAGSCTNATGAGGLETKTLTGLTIGTVYYVRVVCIAAVAPATTSFDICVYGGTSGSCASGLGTLGVDWLQIGNLAANYTHNSQTTCGKVNNITSANVASICGSSSYYGGEDMVYEFTPASSGNSTITVTSTGSWMGIMLYAGCPLTVGTTCVGTSQSSAGNQSMCVNLTAGTTYYLIIDSWPSPTCNPYSLSITAPTGAASGTTCATAVNIAALPYSATGQTTACFGNDYTNASTGSCGSLYESGEDKVYALTVTQATCIGITLTNASTTSIGFQVYSGCPGVVGTTCVGSAGGATFFTSTGNTLTSTVVLPGAGTYYIIVDTWSAPFNATYSISVSNNGSTPANDAACNAIPLTLGVYEPGDNSCSGSAGEPVAPGCWSGGSMNTVWYSFVPTSTSVKIATTLGTLLNTQIQVFSGTCSALVSAACNDNAPTCGSSSNPASQITVTGLTAGQTYFIRVDGNGNSTGTFSILVIDGSQQYPAIAGMDCSMPNPVCVNVFSVADPGYSGYGNICDFGNPYCLASGERNVVWYTIPINAAGTLVFDLIPNDFDPVFETETDYDFAIWKIAGTGATNCTNIAAGTAVPLECNYSGLGVTGLNNTVDLDAPGGFSAAMCTATGVPGAYNPDPSYDGAYQSSIAVANGDVYLLAISNFSNSTSGFTIDFRTSPIGYTAATATSVTWTGGSGSSPTSWTDAANWGGCNSPACSPARDAIIAPFSQQPVLTVGGGPTYYVDDLTIQPGASLTINTGVTLQICGNFTNNGTLTMQSGSTILFNNSNTHQMVGSFTGANKIWNLDVNKAAGSVVFNSNVDIGGNFRTLSATSVVNTNGNYVKVAGDFLNNNGDVTFSNVGTTGTLEFNGTAAQNYNQGSSTLNLQNIVMNNTAAALATGVNLQTNMVAKTATGTLTLTNGRIITGANEVQILNTAPACCTNGNTLSFVAGNLRRFLNGAAATYEFPVGEVAASKGYQRATVAYTAANTNNNLLARFDAWGAVPNGPVSNECVTANYNLLPMFNNGYWTINAAANSATGNYNMTLWPTNVTNNSGAGWSIVKGASTAAFGLQGTCVTTSTATQVQRTGLTGFSVFAVVQSANPLPIELISFTGQSLGNYNRLDWVTMTETNNDYFTIERSTDGINYTPIGTVDGAGTSTSRREYYFNDNYPAVGYNYYRLKQTDFNGQSSYSDIVALEFKIGNMSVSNVKPNPTSGELNFDFTTAEETTIHIVITDMTGRVVRDEYKTVQPGLSIINTGIEEAGAGVYSLHVTEQKYGFSYVTRVVKQ